MQGTAADIIKRAMIAVAGWIAEDAAPCDLIMQVHDELVFEVDAAALDEVAAQVQEIMQSAADLIPKTPKPHSRKDFLHFFNCLI